MYKIAKNKWVRELAEGQVALKVKEDFDLACRDQKGKWDLCCGWEPTTATKVKRRVTWIDIKDGVPNDKFWWVYINGETEKDDDGILSGNVDWSKVTKWRFC